MYVGTHLRGRKHQSSAIAPPEPIMHTTINLDDGALRPYLQATPAALPHPRHRQPECGTQSIIY